MTNAETIAQRVSDFVSSTDFTGCSLQGRTALVLGIVIEECELAARRERERCEAACIVVEQNRSSVDMKIGANLCRAAICALASSGDAEEQAAPPSEGRAVTDLECAWSHIGILERKVAALESAPRVGRVVCELDPIDEDRLRRIERYIDELAPKPPCKTCGGSGRICKSGGEGIASWTSFESCPDCPQPVAMNATPPRVESDALKACVHWMRGGKPGCTESDLERWAAAIEAVQARAAELEKREPVPEWFVDAMRAAAASSARLTAINLQPAEWRSLLDVVEKMK